MLNWSYCVVVCILVVTAACLQDDRKIKWKDCSIPGDHGKLTGVNITPNPLIRGQDFSVVVNTTVDEDVTSGKIKVILDHGLYKFQQVYSLCDMMGIVGLSCPIKKGPLAFKISRNDPKYDPSGTYKGHAEIMDQNGERLFCVDVIFPM